ncbi:S1 family peptidase [Conexibacter sp. JD483]|uniref:S1 family peptidase n=1 Tax=unclassified Conexibacter TaxID=2627773 RepID=UPI00271B6340|nr:MULTISPECIES: S1 family peptidase [unclassified Conexibacter]MDO8184969.1 S1 family peptidase [Conexibacter sp. CPCC 205706]MDO8198113.1 S1 family peptidase [Conexibacter sp. CPCC 205762]MDR9368265.1 S1 family peptidase [Conexibacter sp. JD483]
MNKIRKGTTGALAVGGLLALAGLVPPGAHAIVDGERVTSAQAPWVVSFVSETGERRFHTCSGTAVGPRRVVTARHCVEHSGTWRDLVISGSDRPESAPGKGIALAHVWVPVLIDELRGDMSDSDLAVVETARDLGVPALPLAAAGFAAAPAEPVHAYGFGASDRSAARDEPALLRRAAMRMHTPAECGESDFGNNLTAICAERLVGPGGGNVSFGDSGGGLVREGAGGPELLGVNSVITGGMHSDDLAGFASVPALRGFLDAPERGYELPRPLSAARLRGAARVGGTARCEVRWSLAVKRRKTVWRLTRRGARERRIEGRALTLKLPASARGWRLSCAVSGGLSELYGSTSEWSREIEVKR